MATNNENKEMEAKGEEALKQLHEQAKEAFKDAKPCEYTQDSETVKDIQQIHAKFLMDKQRFEKSKTDFENGISKGEEEKFVMTALIGEEQDEKMKETMNGILKDIEVKIDFCKKKLEQCNEALDYTNQMLSYITYKQEDDGKVTYSETAVAIALILRDLK